MQSAQNFHISYTLHKQREKTEGKCKGEMNPFHVLKLYAAVEVKLLSFIPSLWDFTRRPLDCRLGETQNHSGRCRADNLCCLCQERKYESRFVQPLLRHEEKRPSGLWNCLAEGYDGTGVSAVRTSSSGAIIVRRSPGGRKWICIVKIKMRSNEVSTQWSN
jgi:hypothetical protein